MNPRKPSKMPTQPLTAPGYNRKLGRLPWTFSIPAVATCPGKTSVCAKECYATGFLYLIMRERLNFLQAWSESDSFVADVCSQIRRERITLVRIHVAGDFYSAAYLRKWFKIASRNRTVSFWFYTRSWRQADGTLNYAILAELAKIAELPNVFAWFSEDRQTGVSPAVKGVRRAFAVFEQGDEAFITPGVDLVFRDSLVVRHTPPTKQIQGVQVCPNEDGVVRQIGAMTCSHCSICWKSKTPRKPH